MLRHKHIALVIIFGVMVTGCSQSTKSAQKSSKPETLSKEHFIPLCQGSENDVTCRPRLIIAIGNGDLATVRTTIESGVDPNTKYDIYYGVTALMEAVMTGQVEIAQYLLENGADPSIRIPVDPIKRAEEDGYFGLVEKMKSML